MQIEQSQTQVSFQSTPPKKDKPKIKRTIKRTPKTKYQQQQQLQFTIPKKYNGYDKCQMKVVTNKKIKNYQCRHSSPFQKLFLSVVLALISLFLFSKPPKMHTFLAQWSQVHDTGVFQIVTDRRIQYIKFNLQIPQKIIGYLPFNSIKSANVKAKVDYSVGYQFVNMQQKSNNYQKHHQIQMSDLKILHYHISQIQLQNKQSGFWNSWQFQDTQKLVTYIKQKYIQFMKYQTLSKMKNQHQSITDQKAKYFVTQLIQKSQSWFNWLLKRINIVIDGGLQPYIKQYQFVQKYH